MAFPERMRRLKCSDCGVAYDTQSHCSKRCQGCRERLKKWLKSRAKRGRPLTMDNLESRMMDDMKQWIRRKEAGEST